jgi:hypothetical protein
VSEFEMSNPTHPLRSGAAAERAGENFTHVGQMNRAQIEAEARAAAIEDVLTVIEASNLPIAFGILQAIRTLAKVPSGHRVVSEICDDATVLAGAKVLAETALITSPKLVPACWRGLARHVFTDMIAARKP